MVLWLKLVVLWWNREPSVCAHIWLCCLARVGITISSHNPLWDYINMLSFHKLFLPCEIHYWCQFDNGVSINDLWYRRETESPLWMYTQGYVAWRMLVSRSLVMIHCGTTLMCDLPWTSSFETISMLFVKWSSNIYHLYWIKGHTPFMCGLFSLTLMVTSHIHVPFASFL
jgi:hypothetical protein